MTEYWKSNARVYCDFCKCWYADNKPSKAYHENGRRHKESVAQRLHDINKRSVKEEKAKDKFNTQLRQMEDAALKAYADDISRGNDISTQSFNAVIRANLAGASSSKPVDPLLPPKDVLEEREELLKGKRKAKSSTQSMWVEAKSDNGNSYYWNVKTNESVWVEPKEGYMTYKEYENLNSLAEKLNEHQTEQRLKYMTENKVEIGANLVREQFKARHRKHREEDIKDIKEEIEHEIVSSMDDQAQPLGQWQVVAPKKEVNVDLQLPSIASSSYTPHHHPYQAVKSEPCTQPEVPAKRFKEKTITSLDIGDEFIPSTFKKRTFGNAKRNVRQRTDDD